MGKRSRDKGAGFERAVVTAAKAYGLDARRTAPNQTQDGDAVWGDVTINGLKVECRKRESIGGWVWEWLEGNDVLVLGRNRKPPLAVIPLAKMLDLLGGTR